MSLTHSRPGLAEIIISRLREAAAPRMMVNSPEFKRWFAGSKLVDAEGQPLTLFHGTRSDITTFDASKSGEFGPGIYLTANEGTAHYYADNVARGEHGPNIIPLYCNMQNPFRVTKLKWIKMTERSTPRTVQKRLIAKGFDGIIGVGINGVDEQIVAFRPEQVKSAIANTTFDPEKAAIHEAPRVEAVPDEPNPSLARCTTISCNAILASYDKRTIQSSAEMPRTGTDCLKLLQLRGLHCLPEVLDRPITVKAFVQQHQRGIYFLETQGHAMALVDGGLFDAARKGLDNRMLEMVTRIERP